MSPQLRLKPLLAVSATLLAATATLTPGGGASTTEAASSARGSSWATAAGWLSASDSPPAQGSSGEPARCSSPMPTRRFASSST